MAKSAVPQKSLASQPVIPSEARNLFMAPRFLARKERSLGMTKASFALLPKSRTWRTVVFSDLGILILLALAKLVLHTLTNGQYGWHRDELDTLTSVDNARYLAWGYVSYPPVTPFIARMGLVLFGPSLVGLRLFSSLAVSSVEAYRIFEACQPAGLITNRYGVRNEETRDHPVIMVCRGPRESWPEVWKRLRSFG